MTINLTQFEIQLPQINCYSIQFFFSVLAKAVHSFARIGCELYLEADSNSGLSLRTVNMTKSAFASISFNQDFFSSFIVKSKNIEDNQCKLSMKSCVGVFRNMKQVSLGGNLIFNSLHNAHPFFR